MAKKLTTRIWILIIFVTLSLIAIFSLPPIALEEGVQVSAVDRNSDVFTDGLRAGMNIISINEETITNTQDYQRILQPYQELQGNETLKMTIQTDSITIINLYNKNITEDINIEEIPNTRIKTGLDLQGGSRALVKANQQLTNEELNDLIAVSEQRLNVYGLSDVRFFKVLTSEQENLMGVEIAGSNPEDLEELIASQGNFEAKIGNDTVFIGGEKDVTYVGRSGQDAYITDCYTVQGGEACNFQFVIFLSEEAAQRHADITAELGINGTYLSEPLDLYVDGELLNSLNIGLSLKGSVTTQISISGSGTGTTREEAIDNARTEMKQLQTIMITGSLPYELEIVKIDKISPNLGGNFNKQILLAGLFAILAVSILVFIRYKKIKVSLALITVSLCEVIIILGTAAMIGWNLDLPSIAGIIAAIGTGIDSQLIILDEARDTTASIAQRIKKALFIIVTAFTTTFIALIPLTGLLGFLGIGAASAGLLKGFAVTTLIGITTGVLITRPAFADITKKLEL